MYCGFGQYFWADVGDENTGPLFLQKSPPFLPLLQPLAQTPQVRFQKLPTFSHLSHHKFIWKFLSALGFLAFL